MADVTLKTPLPNFKTRPQGGFFRFRESVHFFPLFVTGLNQWRFQVENFEQLLAKSGYLLVVSKCYASGKK